jgi:hypothetical protein
MNDYFNESHYFGSIDISVYPEELGPSDIEFIAEEILKLKETLESRHDMIEVSIDIAAYWGDS